MRRNGEKSRFHLELDLQYLAIGSEKEWQNGIGGKMREPKVHPITTKLCWH